MNALRDIQAAFLHDIYTGERTSLAFIDTNIATSARLNIYRNNTVLGLTDILADVFPVLKKVVGDEFFKTITRHYIKHHPQPSGNRHSFGANLSGFLTGFKPTEALPYISDLAALEWTYFQASIADNAEELDFEALTTAMSADPAFVLAIHPSVCVLEQTFNALDIWREHQNEEIGSIQLKSERHKLIIWRDREDSVLMRRVSPALAELIAHSQKNMSFAESMVVAGEETSDIAAFQKEFAEALTLGIFTKQGKEK